MVSGKTEHRPKWSRDQRLALTAIVIGIVAITATLAVPEFRRALGLEGDAATTETIHVDRARLASSMGIDYTHLVECVEAGELRQADEETSRIMRHLFGAETVAKIPARSFLGTRLPCQDLRTIDWIWGHVGSNHHFGFAPQIEIWNELAPTTPDAKRRYEVLASRVGWRKAGLDNAWILDPDEMTYRTSAPRGHLPTLLSLGLRGFYGQFLTRLSQDCSLGDSHRYPGAEVEVLRHGGGLQVLERDAPGGEVDDVLVGLLQPLAFPARTVVGADPDDLVQPEVVHVADIGRHALALPPGHGIAPRPVDDGHAIRLLVGEHAREAFVRGHHGRSLQSVLP